MMVVLKLFRLPALEEHRRREPLVANSIRTAMEDGEVVVEEEEEEEEEEDSLVDEDVDAMAATVAMETALVAMVVLGDTTVATVEDTHRISKEASAVLTEGSLMYGRRHA